MRSEFVQTRAPTADCRRNATSPRTVTSRPHNCCSLQTKTRKTSRTSRLTRSGAEMQIPIRPPPGALSHSFPTCKCIDVVRYLFAAINYKGKTLSLCQVTCHHLYQLALPLNKPTAQLRWEEEGVDFGERWVCIYRLPYEVTTSTRLQTLQYRIVHRYFPTRRFLYSRKVIDDPFCDDCGLVDSLYHYFFECHEVHSFWNDLIVKVNVKLPRQRQIKLTRVGVLLGFPRKLPVVNLLMLVAKQFLASQKYRQGAVTYEIFYPNIVKMFSIEKEIARKNGKTDKFMKKWKPFISADGMLDL